MGEAVSTEPSSVGIPGRGSLRPSGRQHPQLSPGQMWEGPRPCREQPRDPGTPVLAHRPRRISVGKAACGPPGSGRLAMVEGEADTRC